MTLSREKQFALALLAVAVAVNAMALSSELSIGRAVSNDNVSHWTMIQGMVRAIQTGENPLDFWSPEGSFGCAPLRTYQLLAHALVALTYFLLGKTVSLMTVFVWIRYLAIVLLPVGFFTAARMIGLTWVGAAASAVLAPLISTDALYGLDYASYVTTGRGLFPQSLAAILLLLAIGAGYRAVRTGRGWAMAGVMLGLTCVCQFVYGWIGAVTVVLAAALPGRQWRGRVRAVALVGLVALAISTFQILPVLMDGPIINHSRWEAPWKWNSFGAATVMKWLLTGQVLDFGRLPVMTMLALGGVGWMTWSLYRERRAGRNPSHMFVLGGFGLWLLVFFGRATWGPALAVLGATGDMHVHRAIAAVQIFLVLAAAIGIDAAWRKLGLAAPVAALLLLAPMVAERQGYLSRNEAGGYRDLAAMERDQGLLDSLVTNVKARGGRTYAGLGTTWGPKFEVGPGPLFSGLYMNGVPQTSASYHILALPSELIPSFEERNEAHYRLFNIRSAIASNQVAASMPAFLSARGGFDRGRVFDAPGNGYFEVVRVTSAAAANKATFYDLNTRWLGSGGPERGEYQRLDFFGDAGPPMQGAAGKITAERQQGQVYEADLDAAGPAWVLFKMTWHPNWVAYVDGSPRKTSMLSPGFTGVEVPAGRHHILMRYEPGWWKPIMAVAGLLAAMLLVIVERARFWAGTAADAG